MRYINPAELWALIVVAAVFGFAAGVAVAYVVLRRPWWLGDDWVQLARIARRRQ